MGKRRSSKSSKPEKVKRLTPEPPTLRELFLKSGNQCAFPGCVRIMMNKEGNFIGQICHIEGAEEGGERFNAATTNEQRRHVSNLVLMCYEHHVVTNDVDAFPVARMQQMKADHEATFSHPEQAILKSITDQTKLIVAHKADSFRRLNTVLGWDLNTDDTAAIKEVNEMIDRLARVPIPTRELFVIIVDRCRQKSRFRPSSVPYHEILTATGLDRIELGNHVRSLERYELLEVEEDEELVDPTIELKGLLDGEWDFWEDLRRFCELAPESLYDIIVNLRFDLLM